MSSVVQQGLMNLKADTAALGPAHRIYPHDHRYLRRMYAKAATAAIKPVSFPRSPAHLCLTPRIECLAQSRIGSQTGSESRLQTARVRNPLRKLEREKGFEPSTLALARRCSTTELFPLGKSGGGVADFTHQGWECQAMSRLPSSSFSVTTHLPCYETVTREKIP